MKKFLWIIVCFMTMIVSANAQNSIVDEFKTNEPSGEKFDNLILDPNKTIKENYAKIDSLMSLHKEKNFAKYTIMIDGHYTSKWNSSSYYDHHIGMIRVKGKNNEYYRTISGQIIEALTELYSNSLDTRFDVDFDDCGAMEVNQKTIKVPTGKTFKRSDGKVTKEYVEKEIGQNTLYYLYSTSPLYKKIYNKVIEETGLKDGLKDGGGRLYDLEQKWNNMYD